MKKLLFSITKKDLEITYFSGTGAGGQHRNRHMLNCRIRHPESGVIVTCGNHKSKERNRKEAFQQLINHPKFKKWHKIKTAQLIAEQDGLEQKVDKMMDEKNLKIEKFNKTKQKWEEMENE
jgi:protein subunit release factor B